MKYFINEDETKIITKDDEGAYDFFEAVEFEDDGEEGAEDEEIKPRPRQRNGNKAKVLSLLAQGKKPKEIAQSLDMATSAIYAIKSQSKEVPTPIKSPQKSSQNIFESDDYKDLVLEFNEPNIKATISLFKSGNDAPYIASRLRLDLDEVERIIETLNLTN